MPFQAVSITIGREQRSILPGAVFGRALVELAAIEPDKHLLLHAGSDVLVPVEVDDLIFIRGGETFLVAAVGESAVESNPILQDAPGLLNDQPLPAGAQPHRAKLFAHEVKSLIGAQAAELWVELDCALDQPIDDHHRIIRQHKDRFFTAPRLHDDRFYEVTVLLDGEAKRRRFPAAMTVLEAIRRSLPPRDRPDATKFDMVDVDLGTGELPDGASLKAAGVRDGHTLSITKKHGGGGQG